MTVVMSFSVGSINYNLHNENSDCDKLEFVLPKDYKAIMLGKLIKNKQYIDEKNKLDTTKVDVRNIMEYLKKPNISNLSFLWSVKSDIAEEFISFASALNESYLHIMYNNRKRLIYSTLGMYNKQFERSKEKQDGKALANLILYMLNTIFVVKNGNRVSGEEAKRYFQGEHYLKDNGLYHQQLKHLKSKDCSTGKFFEFCKLAISLKNKLELLLDLVGNAKKIPSDKQFEYLNDQLSKSIYKYMNNHLL